MCDVVILILEALTSGQLNHENGGLSVAEMHNTADMLRIGRAGHDS